MQEIRTAEESSEKDLHHMRIMITGVAGFLGSHIAQKYVSEGHTLYGVDNLANGNLNNIRTLFHKKNFKFIHEDILSNELYNKIPKDLDAIIHLAAQIHVDKSIVNPVETFRINVEGTQKILEFARIHDIRKVLHASTSEVYGTAKYAPMDESHPLLATHPYGVSKIAADRMCYTYNETYDVGIDIVRCFNLFGPGQKDSGYGGVIAIFINRVLQGNPPIIYGDGNQTRDYMYVTDAVNAYDLILKAKGNPGRNGINFGSGSEVSINQIANLVIKYAKKENEVKPIHVEPRPVEVGRLFADISRANKLLGFEPKVEFEPGLATLMDWYANYKSELWMY
jgi:UDP-glucose 4-epimerase